MNRRRTRRSGFTLIELLLVIGILLVLGTVGVVAYTRIKAGADRDATKTMVNSTKEAIELFFAKLNRYPTTDEGLQVLATPPQDEVEAEKWRSGGGPFLKDSKVPMDPWGNELKYELVRQPGETTGEVSGPEFKIWSTGPDKTDGTDDDIKSWEETQ